jgi:hypothetical protein
MIVPRQHSGFIHSCYPVLLVLFLTAMTVRAEDNAMIYPVPSQSNEGSLIEVKDAVLLGEGEVGKTSPDQQPRVIPNAYEGRTAYEVTQHQTGFKLVQPLFISPSTEISWAWKKEAGQVCIIQLDLIQPGTNQHRYLGYGAGQLIEPPAPDPTVEIFTTGEIPKAWTLVQRNLSDDIKKVLGWDNARLDGFYLSPWDGNPAVFSGMQVKGVSNTDTESLRKQIELKNLSRVGKGQFEPQQLRNSDGKHISKFDTAFEECSPGRNSAANEWSAFGVIGDREVNCMGRDMHVRYPVYDLVFRMMDGAKEIKPDELDSFRLGLVNNRYPAIWGGWEYGNLLYKVSVMTVPDNEIGPYDLYRLDVQNPSQEPQKSLLSAIVEGPPDLRLKDGVVRGLGEAPFLIVDPSTLSKLAFRDWGLCDKRAKGYTGGGTPGVTEKALDSMRIGLDGVPVVYRMKVEKDKKYSVYLAATQHINGFLLDNPKEAGDYILRFQAEGSEPKTIDYIKYIHEANQPLCAGLENCHDVDGDGYIEIVSGVDDASKIRHTRLSAIYVFPQDTVIPDLKSVYSGALNASCVQHINVGITPEQFWNNQEYDKSDIGFARLFLDYSGTIEPGTVKTYWLKVPPIHKREPVSMGYIAHAFKEILPKEAVPPFSIEKLAALQKVDPLAAEKTVSSYWESFFATATQIETPDPILRDIFLSRLATRALLIVNINKDICYDACSPFFYFDYAARDSAYVIHAFDLGGLHDIATHRLNAYCTNAADIKERGPISFDGKPLQLGMLDDGRWVTRPGQHDTQGQNIWCLSEHYKLSGDREWLEKTAYPFIRRGAMWIVESRHKHMEQVGDLNDPRYGLIEPGAMEVLDVGAGTHLYYLSAFAVLGLREAADDAQSLGLTEDAELFAKEAVDLKKSLRASFEKTFKRNGLYEGNLWFGVEPEGVGMYGFWAHNALLWPCRAIDPHDPMLSATWRCMERMAETWGGGMHSEGEGSYWPYIGVDRAISYILRGDPEKTVDYFCAYTDTAGGTFSWGEGYGNVTSAGDQPHEWADAQWVSLFRHLFAFEDGSTLRITPATLRRWQQPGGKIMITGLSTHFGLLDLKTTPSDDAKRVDIEIKITPRGDQADRPLDKILLSPRLPQGQEIASVVLNGKPVDSFTHDEILINNPPRNETIRFSVVAGDY